MSPEHDPVPTSPTGRVDSPVTCSACGKALVPSSRERSDGTLEWDHLPSPSANDVREALAKPSDEQCHYCGQVFPYPVLLHHSEDECNTLVDVREALARTVAHVIEPTGINVVPGDYKMADAILAAFEVHPRGTVTDAEARPPAAVVMHIASGGGTACGLDRSAVTHITNGVRYADCVKCLRTVART